jgi:hypothetical protein
MTFTDIEQIHYNNLQLLLLNSTPFTTEMQHALIFALETIETNNIKIPEKDEKMCSHLVYQFRIRKGEWGYHCMSEEDTCGSCCKNGDCIYTSEKNDSR